MKKMKLIYCPNPDCLYHQEGWESRSKDPRGPKRCPICQTWLRNPNKRLKALKSKETVVVAHPATFPVADLPPDPPEQEGQ